MENTAFQIKSQARQNKYANVIELDDTCKVLNAKYAEKQVTDYIRGYCDPSFVVELSFKEWEVELHEPPLLKDQNNSKLMY